MKDNSLVLVIRHVPFEGLGYFENGLNDIGLTCIGKNLGEPVSPEEWNASAALIVMGGPMSANDPEPWVENEMSLLRAALREDKPVLGVCLGAQLLAKSLGARVYPNRSKEIGWSQVHFTAAAAADPVFRELPSTWVFQWHGETFDLPPASTLLAWNEACRHQAFRIGRAAYGIQFHPEVTPAMILDWCEQDANCGDVRELSAPLQPDAYPLENFAHLLLRRWASLIP